MSYKHKLLGPRPLSFRKPFASFHAYEEPNIDPEI